jgi:hypothetical protein
MGNYDMCMKLRENSDSITFMCLVPFVIKSVVWNLKYLKFSVQILAILNHGFGANGSVCIYLRTIGSQFNCF